jgi:hypothetical protein
MASFSSEHEAPAGLRPRLRLCWLFGLRSICQCVHNWLDDPINFLRGGNGLFDGVDNVGHITALLLFFLFLRFIFPPILLFWHGADFPLVSSPFLPFSLRREALRKLLSWWKLSSRPSQMVRRYTYLCIKPGSRADEHQVPDHCYDRSPGPKNTIWVWSFGFPPIFKDCLNYWLHGLIYFHCR